CDRLLAEAPPGGDAVVLDLLRALVAPRRPESSNMMPFTLSKSVRRTVLRWLDVEEGDGRGTPPDGTSWAGAIEGALASSARRAVDSLSDPSALRAALLEGRAILADDVDPGSPLQAWAVVFDVLEGFVPTILSRMNTQAGLAQVVRGVDLLAQLDAPAELLRRSRDGLERVLGIAESAGEAVEPIRVELGLALGDPEAALAAAAGWVSRAADDADAYLARFRCRVALGDVTYAAFDGAQAIGLALEPASMRARLLTILEEAAAGGGDEAPRLEALARSFAGGEGS
ncbi:MAG: hypothetical protein ACO4CZ_17805, partial [Planctomycetota bacterium]